MYLLIQKDDEHREDRYIYYALSSRKADLAGMNCYDPRQRRTASRQDRPGSPVPGSGRTITSCRSAYAADFVIYQVDNWPNT